MESILRAGSSGFNTTAVIFERGLLAAKLPDAFLL